MARYIPVAQLSPEALAQRRQRRNNEQNRRKKYWRERIKEVATAPIKKKPVGNEKWQELEAKEQAWRNAATPV